MPNSKPRPKRRSERSPAHSTPQRSPHASLQGHLARNRNMRITHKQKTIKPSFADPNRPTATQHGDQLAARPRGQQNFDTSATQRP
jgi:hypothetical protein